MRRLWRGDLVLGVVAVVCLGHGDRASLQVNVLDGEGERFTDTKTRPEQQAEESPIGFFSFGGTVERLELFYCPELYRLLGGCALDRRASYLGGVAWKAVILARERQDGRKPPV